MMRRRGIVLIVVLAIISVLGLLAGTFSFRMNAELAAVKAAADEQQARLAARSGIDRMIHILRTERTNVDKWYDNEDDFRRVPVWIQGEETLSASPWDKDAVPGRQTWRYSIVSYRETGTSADDVRMRYGLTDEAGKINIANLANKALRAQMMSLLDQVGEQTKRRNFRSEVLADSLIDWQDKDDTPISINGAESAYYYERIPRYRAKNRPVQSVDELLMIRGWDALVLFGEDANRNGYLDENEKDGSNEIDTFPPDNGDEEIYRGLLPYITVYSWDWNTSTDNKAKIPLSAVSMKMLEQPRFQYLTQEIRTEVIQFIEEARKAGYKFRSVGELLGLTVYKGGKSNYSKAWKEYDQLVDDLNEDRKETTPEEGDENEEDGGLNPGGQGDGNQGENNPGGDQDADPDDEPEDEQDSTNGNASKGSRRQQSVRSNRDGDEGNSGVNIVDSDEDGRAGRRGNEAQDNRDNSGRPRTWGQQQRDRSEQRRNRGPAGAVGPGEDDEESLGEPVAQSPVTAQEMAMICDRFSVETVPVIPGLINVNTASAVVLRTLPGLTEEQVNSIISQREQLSGDQKTSIGWLVANGAVDAETFALISNMLTTRSIQFSADVIGFADHTGTFKRFEVVVEMRGHLAQIMYFRDISSLGAGYPVWNDEENEGLRYDDR